MGDLITAMPDPEPPYEGPRPEKSTILFELIEEHTYLWTRWDTENARWDTVGLEIEEIQYEGGSAEIEAEQGMLPDAVYGLLDPDQHTAGWWVIEGFYGSFSKDYWGEVDCDFSCDVIRPARWSDIAYFGIQRPPLWVRVLSWFGVDPPVRPSQIVQPVAPVSA